MMSVPDENPLSHIRAVHQYSDLHTGYQAENGPGWSVYSCIPQEAVPQEFSIIDKRHHVHKLCHGVSLTLITMVPGARREWHNHYLPEADASQKQHIAIASVGRWEDGCFDW